MALSHVSLDYVLIGVFFVLVMFDTFRSGAGRACALAIAFSVASILFSMLPQALFLGAIASQFSSPFLQAILFIIVFVVAYLFVHRIGVFYGNEAGRPVLAIIAGVATTAAMLAFAVHTPALQALWHFGQPIETIFAKPYQFWIVLASYGGLAFVRG